MGGGEHREQSLSRTSSGSSDEKRRRRRRKHKSQDRMRLSSSDSQVERNGSDHQMKNARKRKSMSDYIDFKTKESEKDVVPDLRIPAVNRDVNLNASDTKAANCEAPGRRRKLSAELIMSAIQKKASTITTNWRTQKTKSSPEPSSLDQATQMLENVQGVSDVPLPDRRKLNLPVQKLTTIPSVDYHSDSDSDAHSPKDISSPTSPTSPGGRGILKKVSNVELPNLELLQAPASEEEPPPQHQQVVPVVTVNNSPSRMVKFDMPSFDSHTSEEQNQGGEEAGAGLITEQTLREDRAVCEMEKLLEQLQRLEVNISGDHEVMEKFSLERIILERRKWLEVLRKSLSNVLRLQNALKLSEDSGEVACHLIHTDYIDSETQTNVPLEINDGETQTENVIEEVEEPIHGSCPNIRLNGADPEPAEAPVIDFFEDEDLRFDLEQLKYCLETAIVDDYVIL